jgi:glycerol-3-phosphate dehydrogenase
MKRDFRGLGVRRYDLLVVGGGIAGLMSAYDAAQRGLRVALVERHDFGAESSFNNLKTVHGGLRSLQTLDVRRARESTLERRAIARMAPHLVTPQPFLMATRPSLTRGRFAFEAAFLLDGLLTRDKNLGVEAALHLPRGRFVSREVCQRLSAGSGTDGSSGGAMWYDYQIRSVERLNMAVAHAAAAHGAHLVNHAAAVEPIRAGSRVTGMHVRDLFSDEVVDVSATVTLNTAGGGAPSLLRMLGVPSDFPMLKAMNLVSTRRATDIALGAATTDGRLLFMVPWQGRAMFGTSHSAALVSETDRDVSERELSAFVDEVNGAFPGLRLRGDEVALVHRGLVPAASDRAGAPQLRSAPHLRDHAQDGTEGAVSAVAVKYTTSRRVAEDAVDLIVSKVGGRVEPCRTALSALPGAEVADFEAILRQSVAHAGIAVGDGSRDRLIATYGSRLDRVIALAAGRAEWLAPLTPETPAIGAEISHAVREEMACTLADVVLRRTALGSAGYPGDAIVAACAGVMAEELGWDRARIAREIEEVKRFYLPVGPLRAPGPARALS